MKLRNTSVVLALSILLAFSCKRHDNRTEEWEGGKLDSATILKVDESGPRADEALRSLKQRRWDDTVTILRQATRENPKSAAAHYNLGIVLLPTRAHDEGRRELEEALHLNRNYKLAAEALSMSLSQLEM